LPRAHHPCALERRGLLDSAGRSRSRPPAGKRHELSAPGQILLYPGGVSETEILLAYGAVRFASKVGQLAGSHFLTITSGLDKLYELGRMVLYEGAKPVRIEAA